jgi:hypothetical protein
MKHLKEFYDDPDAVYKLYYESAHTLDYFIKKPGLVELMNVNRKQVNFEGSVLMIPCCNEVEKPGKIIQVGEIVFRNAILLVKRKNQKWRLAKNTGYIRLSVPRKEYRRILRRVFDSDYAYSFCKPF